MKRIKYIIVIIAMMALASVLGACSNQSGNSNDSDTMTAKEQEYEYTHLRNIMKNISAEKPPIGDWSYGEHNNGAVQNKIDTGYPIFTIYVNPLATDEIIDMYVEDLMVMDRHMGANKAYLKYERKNGAYTVSFDCMGQEMFQVDLDGKADSEKIKSRIKEMIGSFHEDATAKISAFQDFLASDNDILRGADGEYYFLLDSKNLSDSLDEVTPMIDKIVAAYPFPMEMLMHWNASFKYLDIPGDVYQVYFDEYGNDPLFNGYSYNFSYESYLLYNDAYSHFVPTGSFDDEGARAFYYNSKYSDGRAKVFGGFDTVYTEDGTLSEKEGCDILYELYDQIMTEHEEHGIRPIADLDLSGVCFLSMEDAKAAGFDDERETYEYEIQVLIPMEERISREEFDALVKESSVYSTLSSHQLPDDCG